jgi:hypothetical protein
MCNTSKDRNTVNYDSDRTGKEDKAVVKKH